MGAAPQANGGPPPAMHQQQPGMQPMQQQPPAAMPQQMPGGMPGAAPGAPAVPAGMRPPGGMGGPPGAPGGMGGPLGPGGPGSAGPMSGGARPAMPGFMPQGPPGGPRPVGPGGMGGELQQPTHRAKAHALETGGSALKCTALLHVRAEQGPGNTHLNPPVMSNHDPEPCCVSACRKCCHPPASVCSVQHPRVQAAAARLHLVGPRAALVRLQCLG